MQSANLRKLAASLREMAATATNSKTEKAAHVLDAAVALQLLRQKVSTHG